MRAKILAAIGTRLPPSERDDVMQNTYLRLFAIIADLPEGDEDLIGLAGAVTHGQVIDQHRRNTIRDGRHVDESEAAEVREPAEAPTPHQRVEWQGLYDLAQQAVKDGHIPEYGLRWAGRLAQGDTYEEIGLDEGLRPATVRKRMERIRKLLREHWKKTTGAGGAILAAAFLFFLLRRPATEDIVPEVYLPPPPASTAVAVETQGEQLAKLRSEAQARCDRGELDACEAALDEAKAIDRDHEDRPDVIKMRHLIHDGLRKPQRLKP